LFDTFIGICANSQGFHFPRQAGWEQEEKSKIKLQKAKIPQRDNASLLHGAGKLKIKNLRDGILPSQEYKF